MDSTTSNACKDKACRMYEHNFNPSKTNRQGNSQNGGGLVGALSEEDTSGSNKRSLSSEHETASIADSTTTTTSGASEVDVSTTAYGYEYDFLPSKNNFQETINQLDQHLISNNIVRDMTALDRFRILQNYFPRCFVDAYLAITVTESAENSATKFEITHDELIEALLKVPHLVMAETPVEQYVHHLCGSTTSKDKDIIKQAATKIATHWKIRKYFFQERAFLPMTQTNSQNGCGLAGALSEEDMVWLNSGFIRLVPAREVDSERQRGIVICDGGKIPLRLKFLTKYTNIKLRLSMYCLFLASLVQQQGLIIVSILQSTPSPSFSHWAMFIISEALPLRDPEFHFTFLPSRISRSSLMSFTITAARTFLQWASSYLFGINFHFSYTDERAIQKLASSIRVNRADIPWVEDRGDWDMEAFWAWLKEQMTIEEMRSKEGYVVRKADSRQRTAESERERSKQRRVNAKLKFEELKEKVQDLVAENQQIKEEGDRLEKLLEYAQSEACVLDGLEEELDQAEFPYLEDEDRKKLDSSPTIFFEEPALTVE